MTSTKTLRLLILGTALAVVLTGLGGCATNDHQPPPTLASNVDLNRYMGRWYIVANIPYFLEKGEVGSYVEFSPRPDGDIAETYYGHDKSFDAKLSATTSHDYVVPNTGNARWRTSFIWPIYFTELILYVDPDYKTALIGYPDRSLGWIFARDPELDDPTYQSLLKRLADEGYDPAKFKRVPQKPEEIGQPGFQ